MRLIEQLRAIIAAEARPRRSPSIAARQFDPAALPAGFVDPRQRQGTRRIALTLDQPTFERVRDRAAQKRISFAAAARELIESGAGAAPCSAAPLNPDPRQSS